MVTHGRIRAVVSSLCVGTIVTVACATPQFAREYRTPCSTCHVHVPKLNTFGEAFLANGYRANGLEKKSDLPLATWISLQRQNRTSDADEFKDTANRVEFISGGRAGSLPVSYFVEWRVLSRELLANGSERDRSGRFEDAFLIWDADEALSFQIGQFRALSQVDVSRRIHLGEPAVFSSSLAGRSGGSSRESGLRGFAPSGRSPSIRAVYALRPDPDSADGTYLTAAVLYPGEFSIPLSDEAEFTASHEFEDKPKGQFYEAYARRGLTSMGVNLFVGNNRRRYLGIVSQVQSGKYFFEGSIAEASAAGRIERRYGLGLEWIPGYTQAYGIRFDHRQISGQRPMATAYGSWTLGNGPQALRLVAEARAVNRQATVYVIELGYQF